MTSRCVRVLTGLLVVATANVAWADAVRLRSGKVVDGTLIGADSKTVRLLLANGTRSEFPLGDVEAIELTPRGGSPTAAAQPGRQARTREGAGRHSPQRAPHTRH